MADEPTTGTRRPGATRELRCASRACGHRKLGEVRGDTLVLYLDDAPHREPPAHVGPLPPGAVARVACPRCRRKNIFWL